MVAEMTWRLFIISLLVATVKYIPALMFFVLCCRSIQRQLCIDFLFLKTFDTWECYSILDVLATILFSL